jgi:outer membrane PBP1 activator LpoA protein
MHSINSPARVQAAVRRKEAVDYRLTGSTYREIAANLDVTPTRARQLVAEAMAALQKDTSESAEELRRLELDRLDAMQAAVWGEVEAASLKAINTVLRIMERRAKLAGLDAPVRTVNTHDVTDLSDLSDQELEERCRRYGVVLNALPDTDLAGCYRAGLPAGGLAHLPR